MHRIGKNRVRKAWDHWTEWSGTASRRSNLGHNSRGALGAGEGGSAPREGVQREAVGSRCSVSAGEQHGLGRRERCWLRRWGWCGSRDADKGDTHRPGGRTEGLRVSGILGRSQWVCELSGFVGT